MNRKPRSPDEPIFSGFIVARLIIVAVLMTAGACGLFLWDYFRMIGPEPVTLARHSLALSEAQTLCVTSITFTQIFYLFKCRSLRDSFFSQGVFTNSAMFIGIGILLVLQACFVYLPPLNVLFHSAPINGRAWLYAMAVGAIVLPVILCEKWIRNRMNKV